MKQRLYHLLSSFLMGEITLLLCLPIGMCIIPLVLGTSDTVSFPLLFLAALIPVHILIREFTRSIVSFFLLHTAAAAVCFTLLCYGREPFFAVICLLYIILQTILSIRERLLPEKLPENPSFLLLIPSFAAMAFCDRFGYLSLQRLFPVILGICILMYLFNSYLLNFMKYSHVEMPKDRTPYRQITGTYHMMLGIFGLAAAAVMFAAPYLPLGPVLNFIGNTLLSLIRFLVRLIPGGGSQTEEEPVTQPASSEPVPDSGMMIMETGETFWLWRLLETVFLFLVRIGLIAGIIIGVSFALYRICKAFYARHMDSTDHSEDLLVTERRERLRIRRAAAGKRPRRFFPRSNSERIRRDFYNLIARRPELIRPAMTPKELLLARLNSEASAPDSQTPDTTDRADKDSLSVDTLSMLYDKARYDERDCTREETEEFRRISRTL